MVPEQAIQPGKLRDDIVIGAPIHRRAFVNANFFSGQPLDAAREAIRAADTGERAQRIPGE